MNTTTISMLAIGGPRDNTRVDVDVQIDDTNDRAAPCRPPEIVKIPHRRGQDVVALHYAARELRMGCRHCRDTAWILVYLDE